jgi:hypothetical protein
MIDPALAAELIDIINESYPDRVEQILAAERRDAPGFEGEDIFIIAMDGRKQLAIRLNETRPEGEQVAIKLINASEIDPTAVDEPAFSEGEPPDTVDTWAEEARQAAGPIVDGWVEQVRSLLDSTGGLQEFGESLLTIFPNLDGKDYRQIMGAAMLASSLAAAAEGEEVAGQSEASPVDLPRNSEVPNA